MKQKIMGVLAAAMLTGCVTSPEVFPEGKDAYLLIMSSDYSAASTTDVRIEAHRSATAYCAKFGKRPETITERMARNGLQPESREVELKFKCVDGVTMVPLPPAQPTHPASEVSETSANLPK